MAVDRQEIMHLGQLGVIPGIFSAFCCHCCWRHRPQPRPRATNILMGLIIFFRTCWNMLDFFCLKKNKPWNNSPPDLVLLYTHSKISSWYSPLNAKKASNLERMDWNETAVFQVQWATAQTVRRCRGQLPKLSNASSVYSTWWPSTTFYLKSLCTSSLCKLSWSALRCHKHHAGGVSAGFCCGLGLLLHGCN